VLKTLNSERAHFSLQPLKLTMIQTAGRAACPGSMGHSEAMARTGNIWHENSKFPQASFPNNICVRYTAIGENVGQADYGTVDQDVQAINSLMMAEPHDRATCASTDTHACNILNPAFHQVGIGVYHVDGSTWLTEDFVN
jgi:uncharacterized protein YkwD